MAVDAHLVAAPHHAAGGLGQTWHNLPTAGKVAVVGGLALVLFMVYRAVHGGGAASSALGQSYPTAGVPQDTGGLPGGGALGGGQGQDTSGAPQSANPPQPSVIVLAAPDTGPQPTTSNTYTDNSTNIGTNIGTQNNTQATLTAPNPVTAIAPAHSHPTGPLLAVAKPAPQPVSHPVPTSPQVAPQGITPQALNLAKAGVTTASLAAIATQAWASLPPPAATPKVSTHVAPVKTTQPTPKPATPKKKSGSTTVIGKGKGTAGPRAV